MWIGRFSLRKYFLSTLVCGGYAMDKQIWEGVQTLLNEYAKVTPDDKVMLLYASDSAEPAAWVSAALQIRDIDVRRVWMRPLQDDGFSDRLAASMPSPDEFTGKIVVLTFERDTLSHNEIIQKHLKPFGRERRTIFRAINASAELFSKALRTPPEVLSALNTSVLERCLHAKTLRIKSPGGTDLKITLDNDKFRWVSNRGTGRQGGTVVLPAGEVATFPATVEGVLVADFAFNVNTITDRDARLHSAPVTVWVENRRAVKWECDDPLTLKFMNDCFSKDCVRNVGELGLGTNPGIDVGIPLNSHINERKQGVHLGFGQHNQDPGLVGYDCLLHVDLISKGAVIWIDNDETPLNMEQLTLSTNPHPTSPRDEDAFSPESIEEEMSLDDCCGTLTCDGLQLFSEILATSDSQLANASG
jgi:hypothetical protein